jgi:hypothetical protein
MSAELLHSEEQNEMKFKNPMHQPSNAFLGEWKLPNLQYGPTTPHLHAPDCLQLLVRGF